MTGGNGNARRILIVEDEALVAADLGACVVRMGYTVAGTVDEAEEAIRFSERARPDLALMDIRLKGPMDGIEAAGELRRRFDVPVVFLTSHADEDTLERAGGAEPFGYLVKPFNDRELEATIATALRRHEAESRVVRMERWLDATLRSIGDGVIATDVDGVVTFMNGAAERLCGRAFRRAVARPFSEVFPADADTGQRDIVAQLLADPSVDVHDETRMPVADGEPIPVERTATPIRDHDGTVSGVVVVFRDVSARVRAEAHAREVQRLESLGVLAGGIAHDFNNILVGVLGYAQLARPELPSDSTVQPYLEEIEKAAGRAADLCAQLLAYAGQSRMVVREVELPALVEGIAAVAVSRAAAGVTIVVDADGATPNVVGDEALLRRVVASLVTNALEAVPAGRAGKVTLRTASVDLDASGPGASYLGSELTSGRHALVEVEDDGVGMDEEMLLRVFEPFFSTKFLGRGLGLAAVLGVVRRHDGAIRIDSAPGRGTTARILLPAARAGEPGADPAEAPAPAGAVLVMDDEPMVSKPTAQILRRLGYEVVAASTVQEGLEAVASRTLSVLLLDLTMPGPGPAEVLRRVRRASPDLPVVVMSGYPEEAARERLAGAPTEGFLQKPFSGAELEAAVNAALGA